MGPLQDIRVLDLSRLLPGPFCTRLFADMGADVIKIEEPVKGDYSRDFVPRRGDFACWFMEVNRNKKSVALDSLKVMILSSIPNRDRNSLARSTDMFLTPSRLAFLKVVFLKFTDFCSTCQLMFYRLKYK